MNCHKFFLIVLVFISTTIKAQKSVDTATLVKDFNKVMSFLKEPYLYYTTTSKVSSEPVLSPQDTISFKGICYKQLTNLYYYSDNDEIFLEDSFFIKVNHQRKTLWINKIDPVNKEKLTNSTISQKQLQDVMRKRYSISKLKTDNPETAKLQFENRQNSNATTTTTIVEIEYTIANYLPRMIQMEVSIKQPVTDDMLTFMKEQNISEDKLLQVIDGKKYVVRKQVMSTIFNTIESGKAIANKIPSWKDKIDFDPLARAFIGKAALANYAVTQMF